MTESVGDQPTSSVPGDSAVRQSAAAGLPPEIPRNLGPIRLIRPLGKGGMGIVWLGRHDLLARDVAVKFLIDVEAAREDSVFELFFQGARAAAEMRHPGLNEVLHADVIGKVPYLVLEYLDGPNLSDVVRTSGGMPLREASMCFEAVCDAVAALHEKDLIHRDIKPDNIMLVSDGRVVLTDFGLASVRPPSSLGGTTTHRAGTPAYMAPEMFDGIVSARTDVYALGMTAFHLFAGRPAFSGSLAEIARKHREDVPDLELLRKRDIPAPLIDVIERTLHKQALFRPKTARHVLESWVQTCKAAGLVRLPGLQLESAVHATECARAKASTTSLSAAPSSAYFDKLATLASDHRETSLRESRVAPAPQQIPIDPALAAITEAKLRSERRDSWKAWGVALVSGVAVTIALHAALLLALAVIQSLIAPASQTPTSAQPVANAPIFVGMFAIGTILCNAGGAWLATRIFRRRAPDRKRGVRETVCGSCGYSLKGLESATCPECSHPIGKSRPRPSTFFARDRIMCVLSFFGGLVCGFVAIGLVSLLLPPDQTVLSALIFMLAGPILPVAATLRAFDKSEQRFFAHSGRCWCGQCGSELQAAPHCKQCSNATQSPPHRVTP